MQCFSHLDKSSALPSGLAIKEIRTGSTTPLPNTFKLSFSQFLTFNPSKKFPV
jgi:hypothetical protein